ncbi:hypothetical protein [Cytophaga hutchinsonii]|uniref:GIY-YIG domain-containing protein n=1 Tax=Cytophaga hutchinsonii (strain ATCC 33406 / DSM 1761 / CIP 103989 / NBRC 15051 / NCIMB 9469 / D465) TaxID=269798 RepID=A0A6N4SPC1_CYTH3|nr:hypothetical protein [Cytophaga hutchinsonii]ABG58105.1 hypothetical protein CHU_0818 [Cytophaga hutchinsonii ATCC 33406]SFX13618.1 hypothetical protein SAMN04487930_101653 [Cytophaga hutchinsonii ATCC 33406]
MNEKIKAFSKSATLPLLRVSETGVKEFYQFEIDCFEMKDYNFINVLKEGDFAHLFDKVVNICGPCLYYFEIESDHTADDIVSRIQNYKLIPGAKSVPAIKKKIPQSKVLYVGKVKKGLWGRLVQHLGYYKVSRTQGLQLFYWTQGTNMKLKMHVLEFENEMADYMSVLEIKLAKDLNPILGKHD